MKNQKMNDLLSEYNFDVVEEYFEMITESFLNGQRKQAKNQYNAMPESYKDAYFRDCELSRKDLLFLLSRKDLLF